MKNNLIRGVFVLGIILLFVGTCFASSIVGGNQTLSSDVWIDDDYDENTLGWNVTHFDNIQDGINAVDVYGRVLVNEGTYIENIVIDKKITLKGLGDINETIIDGDGSKSVVEFNTYANYGTIENFKIINSGKYKFDAGIDIRKLWDPGSDGITIRNVFISNCAIGILIEEDCWGTDIKSNIIEYCHQGITLLSGTRNTAIENNIISHIGLKEIHEDYREAFGILVYRSGWNDIIGNTIKDVRIWGISIETSLNWDQSPLENDIIRNTIENCDFYGLVIAHSDKNNIERNNFRNNGNASPYGADISIFRCYDNQIENNNFWDSGTVVSGNYISLINSYGFNYLYKNYYNTTPKLPVKFHWDNQHSPVDKPQTLRFRDLFKYFRGHIYPNYAVLEYCSMTSFGTY